MKRVADADLRLLRIFATVVECKGFAVAQTELNLSASSISGYISALELDKATGRYRFRGLPPTGDQWLLTGAASEVRVPGVTRLGEF